MRGVCSWPSVQEKLRTQRVSGRMIFSRSRICASPIVVAGRLAFEVGAEAQPVHAALEHRAEGIAHGLDLDFAPDFRPHMRPGATLRRHHRQRAGAQLVGLGVIAACGVSFGHSGSGHVVRSSQVCFFCQGNLPLPRGAGLP